MGVNFSETSIRALGVTGAYLNTRKPDILPT